MCCSIYTRYMCCSINRYQDVCYSIHTRYMCYSIHTKYMYLHNHISTSSITVPATYCHCRHLASKCSHTHKYFTPYLEECITVVELPALITTYLYTVLGKVWHMYTEPFQSMTHIGTTFQRQYNSTYVCTHTYIPVYI